MHQFYTYYLSPNFSTSRFLYPAFRKSVFTPACCNLSSRTLKRLPVARYSRPREPEYLTYPSVLLPLYDPVVRVVNTLHFSKYDTLDVTHLVLLCRYPDTEVFQLQVNYSDRHF